MQCLAHLIEHLPSIPLSPHGIHVISHPPTHPLPPTPNQLNVPHIWLHLGMWIRLKFINHSFQFCPRQLCDVGAGPSFWVFLFGLGLLTPPLVECKMIMHLMHYWVGVHCPPLTWLIIYSKMSREREGAFKQNAGNLAGWWTEFPRNHLQWFCQDMKL